MHILQAIAAKIQIQHLYDSVATHALKPFIDALAELHRRRRQGARR
jgi:hypothetical protein